MYSPNNRNPKISNHQLLVDMDIKINKLTNNLSVLIDKPSNPKVFTTYPQDGINFAQDAHPTAYNIQHTCHIPGLAECAVAIK